MEGTSRDLKYCQQCREASLEEFRKVLELKKSGLVIYKHEDQDAKSSKKPANYKEETFLLQNTANRDIKRPEFINELCQYKTKCIQCKTLIQRVRSLLDELAEVKGDQVVGVCHYCKRSNASRKCKRCEYIVSKFFNHNMKRYEDQQKRFAVWLDKVKCLLQTVLEGETICMHKFYKDTSTTELNNLLQQLKKPLSMRVPEIGVFLPEGDKFSLLANLTESEDMLEELIMKIKTDSLRYKFSSDESLNVCPPKGATCACKYFTNKKIEQRLSLEILPQKEPKTDVEETFKKPIENRPLVEDPKLTKEPFIDKDKIEKLETKDKENIPPKITKAKIKPTWDKMNIPAKSKKVRSVKKPSKENNLSKEQKSPKVPKPAVDQRPAEKSKPTKITKLNRAIAEEMPIILNKQTAKEKGKREEKIKLPELPFLKFKERQNDIGESSASILECGDNSLQAPLEMIKGENIVQFDPHYKNEKQVTVKPLLFKVAPVCREPLLREITAQVTPSTNSIFGGNKHDQDLGSLKGIIKYELSNKEFIDKGWTQLPTEKIMRKMNLYKMIPANPQYDWFKRHQNRKIMYYDTGEKLADFDDEGRGKWYYKNGRIALEYSKAKELNASQRYVVYSSGEEVDNGKLKPITVLASFDFMGNGVVYDHYGKIRLKYNQSEGMVIDDKIGPPGRWKWHTLNDPPLLQPSFVDTYLKDSDTCMDYVLVNQKDDKSDAGGEIRHENTDTRMLAIELENFVKAKAHKMLQKFKPFQFRMKVLKINNKFSLRILDQAHIYLLYREGLTSLKLNLGMILISNEIVDTETAEMAQVTTPYDRKPPRSQSLSDIQDILNKAEKIGKVRQKKAARFMNL